MTAGDDDWQTHGEEQPLTDSGVINGHAADDSLVEALVGDARVPAEPIAVGPGTAEEPSVGDAGDASLLALVDRLTAVLEASDLAELEVASGGTTIILRSPAAIVSGAVPIAAAATPEPAPAAEPEAGTAPATAVATAERPSVKAPLTGIFYTSPSPGATPYVAVGNHVSAGQIIGLIEAMKLFNEIKSDLSGRVVRVCADSGALVKAKQPLIEVEPA